MGVPGAGLNGHLCTVPKNGDGPGGTSLGRGLLASTVVLLACALLLTCVALSAVSGLTPPALPPVARPMSGARVVIVRDEDSGTFRQYELRPGKDHAMLHALDNGRTTKFPICLNVLPS